MEKAGQAEVQHLDDSASAEKQVGRLDVAVDEAGRVGVLQPVGGLADVVGGADRVEPAAARDQLLQIDAVHVLHDEEIGSALRVHVVGADDVRMIEGGDGLGLAVEAGQGGGVVGLVGRQHLERDLPPQLEVLAQVDRPHAAGADAVEDEVLADDEPRPPAAHQVVGLERREEAVADQQGGQVARPVRQGGGPAQVGDVRGQPERVQRQALLNQVQKVRGGGWRGHRDHLRGR